MSLITNQVDITLNSLNILRYEGLGYKIPKYKCNNTFRVKRGTKLKVYVKDLPLSSNAIVKCMCDNCNKIVKMTYKRYNKQNHNGLTYCNNCANAILNSGENNKMWNPNLLDEDRKYRKNNSEYSKFILKVLYRDMFTCQVCGGKSNILVHHLNGYNWFKEGRTDETNAITLCENCHKNFHSIYGYGNNTRIQFKQWNNGVCKNLEKYRGKLPTSKIVYCIEDDDIFFIKDIKDKSLYNMIISCCNHKAYTCRSKHYLWYDEYCKMSKDDMNKYIDECNKSTNLPQKIVCVNFNLVFDNIKSASKYFGISYTSIESFLMGKSKTGGTLVDGTKLLWSYLYNYKDSQFVTVPIDNKFHIKKKNYKEMVLCKNDNIVFDSYRLCGKYYNISKSTVKNCCIQGKPTRKENLIFCTLNENVNMDNYIHITLDNIDKMK